MDVKKFSGILSVIIILVFVTWLILVNYYGDLQDDLRNYAQVLFAEVLVLEKRLADSWDEMGNNSGDPATAYAILKDEVIPLSYEIVSQAESINPKSKQLQEIHSVFISAVRLQNQACLMFYEAVTNNDDVQAENALRKSDEVTKLKDEYDSKLVEYTNKIRFVWDRL